jgi:hypothetical protein
LPPHSRAELSRQLGRRAGQVRHDLLGPAAGQPEGGPGRADRRDHLVARVEHRHRHRVQPQFQLLEAGRVAVPADPVQLVGQGGQAGHGVRGEPAQRLVQQGVAAGLGHVGQQHPPAGGGVQRRPLADPVLDRDGGRPEALADGDRGPVVQDRDVDRLTELTGQLRANGLAQRGQVQPPGPGRG